MGIQLLSRALWPGLIVAAICAARADAADKICLAVEAPLPPACRLALAELRATLAGRGYEVIESTTLPTDDMPAVVVGLATDGPSLAPGQPGSVAVPEGPESLAIDWMKGRPRTLVIAGRDARGLVYALRDVARGIELAPRQQPWHASVAAEVGSPLLRVRNVSIHLFNADVERDWYFAESFWRDYFARLSLCRINHFTLTFSDQTNYLCPAYAYLVAMPEYPEVRVEGLSADQRRGNLAMLRRISELADEYAIEFNLGIWMQAPVPRYSGAVRVTGLPAGLELAEYAALGMGRVLAACPQIRGVQLRMNAEAGVAEDQQTDFYRPMFRALRAAGRPIAIDLRYKGLRPSTTAAAIEAGLDVTVSTKFWSEHFGLPYHPTAVDSHWSVDRYSFGAMLARPRKYRVTYQLWNVGSQRLTQWGDCEYAARFARSCQLSGGEGFEIFAPLTDKGYGDRRGAWPVVSDPVCRVGRWEQDRYWFFYLALGRAGYNPATAPEIWRRELLQRFGAAAAAVERAYRAASEVLPLVTAARLPGASEWSWWPEMDTGGNLREYARIQPSDPARFSAIRRWQRTPDWRWEDWDSSPGYVDEVLAGRLSGRATPLEVSDRLHQLADEIQSAWRAATELRSTVDAEWRMTETDMKLLAALAEYHAEKLVAATHFAFYEINKDSQQLQAAVAHLRRATEAWRQLVTVTEPVYHHDLVFGVAEDSPRSVAGHHHTGHWRDRLPELEADVAQLERQLAAVGGRAGSAAALPLESRAARPAYVVKHVPPLTFQPGASLELRLSVEGDRQPQGVIAHVRPLDQTRPWRQFKLVDQGGAFAVVLPPDAFDANFDGQYYFELTDDRGAMLWPSWQDETPYFVVRAAEKKS